MRRYTIVYFDAHDAILMSSVLHCACDDDAIEIVGESTHPYAMHIFESERQVARCPPLRNAYPFGSSDGGRQLEGTSR